MAQGSNDFEALARQYWGMWGDAMRGAAPQAGADAGLQGFRDALGAWTNAASGGQGGFGTVLGHFNRQSGDWFARMQQVAAQFAGREHGAQDVAKAWQRALGGNPFDVLFQGMRGPGLEGLEQWSQAAAPWLQNLRSEAAATLGMPAFGFAREHQQRLQALGQAQLRWQDALSAYNALMATTSQDAYARFEAKLAEREEPGRQIGSVRALFDLWVDAAEEAHADTALSMEYRTAYGELVNAQMTLRAASQAIAEQTANMLGMPGRTELDSAHRKIAELERQLRRMQRKAGNGDAGAEKQASTPAPEAAPKPRPGKSPLTPAAKKSAA
ncbi:MAG: class III poly(R)-hydroxyalkanoic acid synthase subunit PhaE, partial [Lysobacteraceae bacterium]